MTLLLRFLSCAAVLVAVALAPACGGGSGDDGADARETVTLPLVGEPPAGLTADALGPALAAAEEGLGYDFESGVTVPAAAPSQLLIRPGSQIFPESIFPGWCTAAFVFDVRTRIATAGHCTRTGDAVLVLSAPSTLFVVGVTSKSTGLDSEIGDDWALIDIHPEWQFLTDPSVALVGGPCGRANDPAVPLLKYVGHAAGGSPRAGLLVGREDGALFASGLTYFGDSGAPVLEATQASGDPPCAAGGAVGILTHAQVLAVGGIPTAPTGFFLATPIARIGNSLDDGTPF